VSLAIALVGLEPASETSLTTHMVQHVILMVVAAPLLALGAPRVIQYLPAAIRKTLGSVSGSAWGVWAGLAVLAQAVAMVVWHLPEPFEAAARHDIVHAAEHLSLLGTSLLLWWVVFEGRRAHVGLAIGAMFAAALVCTALGAAIALAGHTWYPAYRSLSDQQMAGVVMWSLGGVAYLVGAVVLFFTWLTNLERSAPGGLVTSA